MWRRDQFYSGVCWCTSGECRRAPENGEITLYASISMALLLKVNVSVENNLVHVYVSEI